MPIYIPQSNVDSNISYGQLVNEFNKQYIAPELRRRKIESFQCALINITGETEYRVFLNEEVLLEIEFKKKHVGKNDVGKPITIDLKDVKDINWRVRGLRRDSAKILLIHFSKNWWILKVFFGNHKHLKKRFQIKRTFRVRGGGYLPLQLRKEQKGEFLEQWSTGLHKELPSMWKRHITVSQRYTGVMVYDGNYYDLFLHASELFVLGYYYATIMMCRTAAEQALVTVLINHGKAFEIKKGSGRIKGLEDLVSTCRSFALFDRKYPINKTSARKLNEISRSAGELVHPKHDIEELDHYKSTAVKCMDDLYYVIKNHLNFVKDTEMVSGYRFIGTAKRLR